MESDAELLQSYVERRSEEAFAVLVRRYLPLVLSAALRRLGQDRHRAEDVAQMVFTTLAQKAGSLRGHPVLTGWLHTTCYHYSTRVLREERRRAMRDEAASTMGGASEPAIAWEEVRPVIDEALLELDAADRDAVLLRFFQSQPFSEIGRHLSLTENAARMRVERALDTLHGALARRGIRSTGGAIGLALAAESGAVAAPGLASLITANAVAATSGGMGPLGIFLIMSKIKIAAGVGVLVAGALFSYRAGERNAARQQAVAERIALAVSPERAPLVKAEEERRPPAFDELRRGKQADALQLGVPVASPAVSTGAGRAASVARLKSLYAPALDRFGLSANQLEIVGNGLFEFSMANAAALVKARAENPQPLPQDVDRDLYLKYLDEGRAAPIAAMKSVLGEGGYELLMAYRQSPEALALNQVMILEPKFAAPEVALSEGQRAALLRLMASAVAEVPVPVGGQSSRDPSSPKGMVTVTPAIVGQAEDCLNPEQVKVIAALVRPARGRAAGPLMNGFGKE